MLHRDPHEQLHPNEFKFKCFIVSTNSNFLLYKQMKTVTIWRPNTHFCHLQNSCKFIYRKKIFWSKLHFVISYNKTYVKCLVSAWNKGQLPAEWILMESLWLCLPYQNLVQTSWQTPRLPSTIRVTATLIARFMGPTWGPSGADRTQEGPMLAPWTLLSGNGCFRFSLEMHQVSTYNNDNCLSWCSAIWFTPEDKETIVIQQMKYVQTFPPASCMVVHF